MGRRVTKKLGKQPWTRRGGVAELKTRPSHVLEQSRVTSGARDHEGWKGKARKDCGATEGMKEGVKQKRGYCQHSTVSKHTTSRSMGRRRGRPPTTVGCP